MSKAKLTFDVIFNVIFFVLGIVLNVAFIVFTAKYCISNFIDGSYVLSAMWGIVSVSYTINEILSIRRKMKKKSIR